MREIKFRVWCEDCVGYLYSDMTYLSGDGNFMTDDLGDVFNMSDKTIELYTGIKDINGVEVYEVEV